MESTRPFFRRYELTGYFVMAFLVSWGAVLILLGPGALPADPDQAQTIGLGLLLGPVCAMVVVTALGRGREGFRELWTRATRWRIRGRYYVMAMLAAPASVMATLMVLSLWDPQFMPRVIVSHDRVSLLVTGIGAGLFIATFEELGWTGFAVPRLLEKHGTLRAGAVTGVLWGLWHFPPFWQEDSFASGWPLVLLLARLFTWIVAFRVLMVWLYRQTRSLPAVVLMHTSLVVCMIAIEPALEGAALLTYILCWTAVLWSAVGVGAFLQRKSATPQS
jgi:membrane protease YdiL (CAAX protease family)